MMKNSYKIIHYYSQDDNAYLAFAPELPGCVADGKTLQDAINNLMIIIEEWKETAKECGLKIPRPTSYSLNSTNPDILDVAKYILKKTGTIGTVALEKLAYYCLVWSLVWYDKPLFKNQFQAWQHGPVCKELYDAHRKKPTISQGDILSSHRFTASEKRVMDSVIDIYGSENEWFLEALTHKEAPWLETRGNLPLEARSNEIITNKKIKEAYAY